MFVEQFVEQFVEVFKNLNQLSWHDAAYQNTPMSHLHIQIKFVCHFSVTLIFLW